MKKIYILSVVLALFALSVQAQNVLSGSNMEDENAWMTSALNQDAGNSVIYEFNHTTNTPSQGSGGCLYISGTNTGSAGGQLTNYMFYQQITIHRGVNYTFDAAYMDVRSNNYWFEVYVGGNEPAVGSDYGGDQQATLIEYIKSSNWDAACANDQVDGLLSVDGCFTGDMKDIVFFEGTGDTTVYFGFRMGIWDDGGNGYTFETYVDNVTLTGETNSISSFKSEAKVYPNPFNSMIYVENEVNIEQVEILNIIGQTVRTINVDQNQLRINMEGTDPGVYFVVVRDQNGNSSVTKLIRN